mmetsp:Transcript_18862/g.33496  ORF Transcript_18862/g.33496 Transcript_18862/m.33496 type:complete len:192 (-) Transcript_18862:210-785(-)
MAQLVEWQTPSAKSEMHVIALTGLSGRDRHEFCEGLNSLGYHHVAIADSIKRQASELSRVPLHYFYESYLKDTPVPKMDKTPRDLVKLLCATIGKTSRLRLGPSCTPIHALEATLESVPPHATGLVISDLKRVSEAKLLARRFEYLTVVHVGDSGASDTKKLLAFAKKRDILIRVKRTADLRASAEALASI